MVIKIITLAVLWFLVGVCIAARETNDVWQFWQQLNDSKVSMGYDCITNAQCMESGAFCEPILEFCVCRDDDESVRHVSGKTLCTPFLQELRNSCNETSDCRTGKHGDNKICLTGKCQCATDFINEPGSDVCLKLAVEFGAQCLKNSQCKANLGDLSECVDGICVCTPTYGVQNQYGNFCLPVVNTIGAECLEPQQCKLGQPGPHSECRPSDQGSSLVCNCSDGAFHQQGRSKCYKTADIIGAECEINRQCEATLGNLTGCGSERKCDCLRNISVLNQDNSTCLPIRQWIGDFCEESQQCTLGVPGGWSECRDGGRSPHQNVCACRKEAVKDPDSNTCYKKATNVGDPCLRDVQCAENLGNMSSCTTHGTCVCINGTVANMEGSPKTQCIPGGILLGKTCFDPAQCSGIPGKTSTCTQGAQRLCGCLPGYTGSIKLNDCLVVSQKIGEICTEPQQCQQGYPGKYSDCIKPYPKAFSGVCGCTPDAITESGRNHCYLKATQVNDPCQLEIQCEANLEHSQCLEGHCVCLQNSTASADNKKCIPKRNLGEACGDNNQCLSVEHAICQALANEGQPSTCQCNVAHITHPNQENVCIKLATVIGDSCKEHPKQCDSIPEARCNKEQVCACNDATQVVSTDQRGCLEMQTTLQSLCKETLQCRVPDSACLYQTGTEGKNESRCVCSHQGFVESDQFNKCLPLGTEVGQICEESKQCTLGIGDNTFCHLETNTCRCTPPMEYLTNSCYHRSTLGSDCQVDEECHLGVNNLTQCSQPRRKCICKDSAVENNNTCLARKRVGDPCQSNVECSMTIEGSVFCNQVCTCHRGYEIQADGMRCSTASSHYLNLIVLVILYSIILM